MDKKFLLYQCGVCVLLIPLIFFFAGSCSSTEPIPPVSGNIVITTNSDVDNPLETGYFFAVGTLWVEEGNVTTYDYQKTGNYVGEVIYYQAESGHVDFTVPGSEGKSGSAKQAVSGEKRQMKTTEKGAGGTLFSNIAAMVVRVEEVASGQGPVEPPIVTESSSIVFDAEMQWESNRLTLLDEYENYLDARSTRAASPDSEPYRRSEYLYDGSGRLERICSGPWYGDQTVEYYDRVSVYSGYDPNNPRSRTSYYTYDQEDLTQYPDLDATPEITSVTCPVGESLWTQGTGKYFRFTTPGSSWPGDDWYVWYNVDGNNTDPTYGYEWAIEVVVSVESNEEDVAAATLEAISASGAPVSVVQEGAQNDVVTITNDDPGDVDNASQVYQGPFVISITDGYPIVDRTEYSITYDPQGRIKTLAVGSDIQYTAFYDGSGNLESLQYTMGDGDWDPRAGTVTFILPEGLTLEFTDFTPWTSVIGNMIIQSVLPTGIGGAN